jgi:DNA-binding CsgD family transcriptional regulator
VGSNGSRPLTPRQRQLVALVRRGLSNREIADELGISEDGVKAHLSRLYLRHDVTNRVALLAALGGDLDGRPSGSSNLGELRVIARTAQDRVVVAADGAADLSERPMALVRETLAAVGGALDLVRDLPADTTGPVIAVLRKRISAALAALDAASADAATGAARAR